MNLLIVSEGTLKQWNLLNNDIIKLKESPQRKLGIFFALEEKQRAAPDFDRQIILAQQISNVPGLRIR